MLSWLVAGALAVTSAADTTGASCAGHVVSAIAINPQRPPFSGTARRWQIVAHAVGLHHVTTRPEVIRPYLLLKEGDVCTPERVTESERMIRSLPYLADAKVSAEPDSAGGVIIDIETVDEIPVLVTGGLRNVYPASIGLGNENISGLGLRLMAGIASKPFYRASSYVNGSDYTPFGLPVLANFEAVRDQLGSHFEADVARLFLSNLQRGAWTASYRVGDDFPLVTPPVGDQEALEVHQNRWSIGGVIRASFAGNTALIGPVVLGHSISPLQRTIVVTDSGPVERPDSALIARMTPFHSTRLGGLLGLRRVRFVQRTGLDALFATQDVMVGWQIGTMLAPGATVANGRDMLVAQSAYIGSSWGPFVARGDLEGEARRDFSLSKWSTTVGNAHAGVFWVPNTRLTFNVEDNLSILGGTLIPSQLGLDDPIGGARGFNSTNIVGGRRNVIRSEVRFATPHMVRNADVGVALFTDFAEMWAGDVPYGVNATARSVGFSLLAAYPTRSKRTYHLDLAMPTHGGTGVQVRFSSGDPTSMFVIEPDDVTRARLAPVPSSLFAWPQR